MGGRHVAVRVIGITSTTHGLAFAVLEGPSRLVDWGVYRLHASSDAVAKALDRTIVKNRPLFIALDRAACRKKRSRGKSFVKALDSASVARRILILNVDASHTLDRAAVSRTKWDIAAHVAGMFSQVAHKLPARRKPWQSEDDRVGLFLAIAAAVVAWKEFREPKP